MKRNEKVKIGIVGISGRMGKAIAINVLESSETKLEAGSEKKNHPSINKDIGLLLGKKMLGINVTSKKEEFFKNIDVVIEFGLGKATKEYLKEAKKYGIAFLSGSTGIDKQTERQLKEAAEKIPVFWSPNMSIGANIVKEVSGLVAEKLPSEFDIDITDLHHKNKKDIPSGTAIAINKNIELELKKKKNFKKPKIHAFRSGDSTGEHAIIFSGKGERIEIKHISTSREIFSSGAVKVATWLHKKKKGFYKMQDYLSN